MHPVQGLNVRERPECTHVIHALKQCHVEHSIAKFWGKCNPEKLALDTCLRAEKKKRVKRNRTISGRHGGPSGGSKDMWSQK
jgi:COX assembly protein 2